MPNVENIMLGSGKLYIAELDESGTIPTNLFTDTNCVGDIKGGAELSYKPEITEIKNDFDEVRKAFIKSEEVLLKSGVLTWDLPTMEKLTLGGTYDSSKKELKIGGKTSVKQYAIGFEHSEDIHVQVTLKGYNQSGFTIKFDPENPSTVDAEFKAIKQSDKTLVSVKEITADQTQ